MSIREHESIMRWAIALALEGAGHTSPNPVVGAVVVRNGKTVGEGYHHRAGTPHAEIHALRKAGSKARGADLYVTLEPCCYTGRTPPCTDAIIESGIKRVFIGARDPNPLVSGRGIRALRKAGIKVFEKILEKSCRNINRAYNRFITTSLPYVTAKVALTLDGKIAAADGSSRWITNEACRRYVHELRAQNDAIMVGLGTVRADDPALTVRTSGFHGVQPKVVIVDSKLNIPRRSRLLLRPKGTLIFATTNQAPLARFKRIANKGHQVLVCRVAKDGHVDLKNAMSELAGLGITSVLIEGGGQIFADAIQHGLVQRIVACIAPKFLGGKALDFLPGILIKDIKDAITLDDVNIKLLGDNVVIEGMVN